MYAQGMDPVRYEMMMTCLPIAETMNCCEFYIKFLSKQVDTIGNVKKPDQLNIEIDVHDDQLERFC